MQVTDAKNPVVLGNLYMSGDRLRIWCDAKVYANHVYIIREVNAGLQASARARAPPILPGLRGFAWSERVCQPR